MGQHMQVYLVLYDTSIWVWTPILEKRGHKGATRRVPGATLQHWDSTWMCAPRLYVMRPWLAFVWRLPEFLAGRSSSPSRRNRVTIHFPIPLRFDSRNDGLRRWSVGRSSAAQRCTVSSPPPKIYSTLLPGRPLCRIQTLAACFGPCACGRLVEPILSDGAEEM